MRSLRRHEAGAAAIEYAIIAALIGIGLIGALVGTRTSLSSVFGTAATKMAGGPSSYTERAVAPASSSSRASFWGPKTLASSTASQPDPQTKVNTFTYTDGSMATFTRKYDANGVLTGETLATRNPNLNNGLADSGLWTFDGNGAALSQDYYTYYSQNGPVQLHETISGTDGWISHELWYSADGSFQRSYNSPAGTYSTVDGRGAADEVYFRGLSAS